MGYPAAMGRGTSCIDTTREKFRGARRPSIR